MTSTQEVDVEMKHRLTCSWTYVKHSPVSLPDVPLARNLGRRQVAAADHFGIFGLCFLQSCKVLLGDDKYMRGSLWVDVIEGQYVRVLVNLLGGNLAAENAAEEAVARGISHGSGTMAKTITHASTTETRRATEKEELEPETGSLRDSAPPWRTGLIQSHQEDRALRRFGFRHQFLGTLAIIAEDAHPYPPIARGTGESQHLRRAIAAREVVG